MNITSNYSHNYSNLESLNIHEIATDFSPLQTSLVLKNMFERLSTLNLSSSSTNSHLIPKSFDSVLTQLSFSDCASLTNATSTILKCTTLNNEPIEFYFEPRKIGYKIEHQEFGPDSAFLSFDNAEWKLNHQNLVETAAWKSKNHYEVSKGFLDRLYSIVDLFKNKSDQAPDSSFHTKDIKAIASPQASGNNSTDTSISQLGSSETLSTFFDQPFSTQAVGLGGAFLTSGLAIYTVLKIINLDNNAKPSSKKSALLWTAATIASAALTTILYNNIKS